MLPDPIVEQIETQYSPLTPCLNQRSRRLWAATEASALGYGGILAVHRTPGISPNTICSGLRERENKAATQTAPERIRQSGGGHQRVEEREPPILAALDRLVEPSSRGAHWLYGAFSTDLECQHRTTLKDFSRRKP